MAVITVVATSSRNTGTYTSPSWRVPATMTKNVILRATLPLADLQDVRNHIDLKVQTGPDGIDWSGWGVGIGWDGGNYLDRQGGVIHGPGVAIDFSQIAGLYVRLIGTLNRRMTVGLEIEAE